MKKNGAAILSTRKITIVGLLSAISIVLGMTGYGFIPLPFAKATFLHIPVIIGAILEGPLVGALIGLIFGLFSIFQNIVTPTVLSFAFINPLVSVLPRVLIGLMAYGVYRLCFRLPEGIKSGVAAAAGSLTNTIGVLGMIYLLYAARYAAVHNIGIKAAAGAIFGVALTNGIAEAIVAVLITVPVVMAVKRIRK